LLERFRLVPEINIDPPNPELVTFPVVACDRVTPLDEAEAFVPEPPFERIVVAVDEVTEIAPPEPPEPPEPIEPAESM
jgi:hypothetical protein